MAMQPPDIAWWQVPRCWPGQTVALLGGGESLTTAQVNACRGVCRVVAINRAFRPAPWADWLWGCDADPHRFWGTHPDALEFDGVKIVIRGARSVSRETLRSLDRLSQSGVRVLRHSARDYPAPSCVHEGMSPDPAVMRGNNALFQILSIIVHTGAARVLLLGADMRGNHWHGGYKGQGQPNYAQSIIPPFATLVRPLDAAGVDVVNCSPGSALQTFPQAALGEVL